MRKDRAGPDDVVGRTVNVNAPAMRIVTLASLCGLRPADWSKRAAEHVAGIPLRASQIAGAGNPGDVRWGLLHGMGSLMGVSRSAFGGFNTDRSAACAAASASSFPPVFDAILTTTGTTGLAAPIPGVFGAGSASGSARRSRTPADCRSAAPSNGATIGRRLLRCPERRGAIEPNRAS